MKMHHGYNYGFTGDDFKGFMEWKRDRLVYETEPEPVIRMKRYPYRYDEDEAIKLALRPIRYTEKPIPHYARQKTNAADELYREWTRA
jgi:hypothetical protein